MRIQTFHFCFFILLLFVFGSCKEKKVNEAPASVVLTSTPKDTQVLDPYAEPQSTNMFENLVSDWENKNRVIWQKPDLVISLLGNLEKKTVADIGAGTGYFAFRLVPKAQKVIAIDIDKRFIDFMDSIKVRLSEGAQARFESRLTTPENPRLAEKEADIVMLVDTYGYIENREKYLNYLKKGLKPGGEILIIDFKKENLPVDIAGSFTISLSNVVKELESAGFTIKKVDNTSLDYQYIIQASKSLKE
jgi:ubiquinone/menaquinone biosynthesis C-methylase UbiE